MNLVAFSPKMPPLIIIIIFKNFAPMCICVTFSGVVPIVAVQILSIPLLGATTTADALEWTFLILLPNFCFGQGLMVIYMNKQNLETCNTPQVKTVCDKLKIQNPCCKGKCCK